MLPAAEDAIVPMRLGPCGCAGVVAGAGAGFGRMLGGGEGADGRKDGAGAAEGWFLRRENPMLSALGGKGEERVGCLERRRFTGGDETSMAAARPDYAG